MKNDAEVTIKFVIEDVCNEEDLDEMDSFEQMVIDKIEEEGLYSLIEADDDCFYEVVEVKKIH